MMLAALCWAASGGMAAGRPPNVVLILADDLGWADLSCYGADLHETPHLDRLASHSVRFTQAYSSAPVCTPTRAAIMTGQAPARLGITIWSEGSLGGPRNRLLLQAESSHDLPHTRTTLATLLQRQGYLTALVGKWHLGDADHYPQTHGFDVNIGGTHWGAPTTFFFPYSGAGRFGTQFRYVSHLGFGETGEYLTDRLTDEALQVIDHAGERPFFLYLAHHAPHTPIEAKADDIAHFRQKLRPDMHHQNAVYAAMIKSLDDSVGRVIARLAERGLEKDTIVVFTSDNGGYIGVDRASGQQTPVTNNSPLRSGKGSLYEGGIRVPLMVHWPGVIMAGTCDAPVILTDLFPTLAAATKLEVAPETAPDGVDLWPLLKNTAARLDRDALFFHYPHYYETATPVSAVRSGEWKLLEYLEDDRVELYNLRDDPSEKSELASAHADQAESLRSRLHAWRQEVGARMPTVNPDFRRAP
jgi:arylsulfatase A-like enzyme